MYGRKEDYTSKVGLTRITLFIKSMKEYEGDFDVNKYLNFVKGREYYMSSTKISSNDDVANGLAFFTKCFHVYTLLEKELIDKAYDVVSNFNELEKENFRDSIRSMFDTYGLESIKFIWLPQETMETAKDRMEDYIKEIHDEIYENGITKCDKLLDNLDDVDNFEAVEEIYKLQCNTMRNTALSASVIYSLVYLSPDVADKLLAELDPGFREKTIKIIEDYATRTKVDKKKSKLIEVVNEPTLEVDCDNVIETSEDEIGNKTKEAM